MFKRKNDGDKPNMTSSPAASHLTSKPLLPALGPVLPQDDPPITPVENVARRNLSASLSPNHKRASTYSPACTTATTTTAVTTGEIGQVSLNSGSSTSQKDVTNGSSRSRRTSTAMSTRSARGNSTVSYNRQPSWRTAALPASVSRADPGSVSVSGPSTLSGSEPSMSFNGAGSSLSSRPQRTTASFVSSATTSTGGAPIAASVSIVFAEPETVAPAMGSATRSMDRTVRSVTSRSSLREVAGLNGVEGTGQGKGKERDRDGQVSMLEEQEEVEEDGERASVPFTRHGLAIGGVVDSNRDSTPISPSTHPQSRSTSPSHPHHEQTDPTSVQSHAGKADWEAPSLPPSQPPAPASITNPRSNTTPTPTPAPAPAPAPVSLFDPEVMPPSSPLHTFQAMEERESEPKFEVEVLPPTPKALRVVDFPEGESTTRSCPLPGTSNVDTAVSSSSASKGANSNLRWRWGRSASASASASNSGRSTPTKAKMISVSTEHDLPHDDVQKATKPGKTDDAKEEGGVSAGETKNKKKRRKWFTSPPPTPPPLTSAFVHTGETPVSNVVLDKSEAEAEGSTSPSSTPAPPRLTIMNKGESWDRDRLVEGAGAEAEEEDGVPGTPPPEYVDAVAALRRATVGMHESLMGQGVDGNGNGGGGGEREVSSSLTTSVPSDVHAAPSPDSESLGVGQPGLASLSSTSSTTTTPVNASTSTLTSQSPSTQKPTTNDPASNSNSNSNFNSTSAKTKRVGGFLFGYGSASYGYGVGGVLPLGMGAGAGMGMGMGLGAPLLGVGVKSGGGGECENGEKGVTEDGHADPPPAAAGSTSTVMASLSPSPSPSPASTTTISQPNAIPTPIQTIGPTTSSSEHEGGSVLPPKTQTETTMEGRDGKSEVVENANTVRERRAVGFDGKKRNGTWWDYVGWSSSGGGGGGGGGGDAPCGPGSGPGAHQDKNVAVESETGGQVEDISEIQEGTKSVDAAEVGVEADERGQREGEGNGLLDASKRDDDGRVEMAAEDSERNDVDVHRTSGSGVDGMAGTVQRRWLAPWSWYYSSPSSDVGRAAGPAPGPDMMDEEEEDTKKSGYEAGADAQAESHTQEMDEAAAAITEGEDTQGQLEVQTQPQITKNRDDEEIADTLMIKTQTSTWASFFSSNGLLVKSLAYASSSRSTSVSRRKQVTMGEEGVRKDEHGAEVMDIDSDDDHDDDLDAHRGRTLTKEKRGGGTVGASDRAAVVSASGSALPGATTKSGANPRVDSSSTTTTTKMSTPTSTSSTSPAPRSIAATITSTTAQTLKRAVSPAPSTSSSISTNTAPPSSLSPIPGGNSNTNKPPPKNTSSSTPTSSAGATGSGSTTKPAPAPPAPNLVLPSWNDTFFVPPRSIVPPRPKQLSTPSKRKHKERDRKSEGEGEGLFGKTIKFVSGVLFAAKDAGANAASGQPPPSPSSTPSTKTNPKGKEREQLAHNLSREMNLSSSSSTSTLSPESGHGHGHVFPLEADTDASRLLPKAWKVYEDAGWDIGVRPRPRSRSRSQNAGVGPGEEILDSSPAPTYPYPLSSSSPSSPTLGSEQVDSDGEMEGEGMYEDILRGSKRIVVIGVHGWFPGTMIRSVLGEPTGTSHKFASMTCAALSAFEVVHGVKFDKVTMIPLEGEGVIERRVERLHQTLLANPSWVQDLHDADAVIVATHSQGSVVSTHLVERLLREGVLVSGVGGVVGGACGDENENQSPVETEIKAEGRIGDEKTNTNTNNSRAGSRSQSRTPVVPMHPVSASLSGTQTPTTPTSPAPISPSPSSASASGSGPATMGIGIPAKDKGSGKTGGSGATSPLQLPTPSGSYKPPAPGPSIGPSPSPAQAQLQAISQLQSTTQKIVTRNTGAHKNKNTKPQKMLILALCGIHLGPLRYLGTSTLVGPYLQWFESAAARELFEFQNTESAVSKAYVKALERVLAHGTKIVYVASLNDQVVPIYSGLFTAVSHPLILRALYIDGDAYHSSDFLSNLLVLLLRIKNAGLSDSGLIAHLSEATAGSLNGVGHSTAYEELGVYALAVNYLFLVDDGAPTQTRTTPLHVEHFNAAHEQNDYEIPWSLRDVIANPRVSALFGKDIGELRDAFREWNPKTTILRDLKRKLSPIQRLAGGLSAVGSVKSVESKL